MLSAEKGLVMYLCGGIMPCTSVLNLERRYADDHEIQENFTHSYLIEIVIFHQCFSNLLRCNDWSTFPKHCTPGCLKTCLSCLHMID